MNIRLVWYQWYPIYMLKGLIFYILLMESQTYVQGICNTCLWRIWKENCIYLKTNRVQMPAFVNLRGVYCFAQYSVLRLHAGCLFKTPFFILVVLRTTTDANIYFIVTTNHKILIKVNFFLRFRCFLFGKNKNK